MNDAEKHPHGPPPLPRLIAWEVTRSCRLDCRHCRAAARFGPYENELSTEECFRVLDNVASFCKPIVILTGGEPMLREDIWDIARRGTELGLRMVMAPCGEMVTEEAARRMIDCGIRRISLSLDGATAETHDAFRRVEGSFDSVMQAARNARAAGLEFQINTTITRRNAGELDAILRLAVEIGAAAYHPFLLVPTGRGRDLADEALSPEEYERVLNWIYEQRESQSIPFKPTCAPHYYRIVRQREKAQGRSVTPRTHGLDAMTKGCMGGQSFAFISHIGKVQICGFLEVECGDLRAANYDFKTIWETSDVFRAMRNPDEYGGRCGYCEYRRVCGGCRARAYAMTGDYLAEEPFCVYQPIAKK
ncbi:heme b synthase [Candidatus Sumerlaeota bacterium]|nr:heme b synthase [Candidatus Sumerlaeota bacterium]